MAKQTGSLQDRLSRHKEITLTVTGRKSRKNISNPVWFVLDGSTLYLLPVKGSATQWYKNVLANPSIRVEAGGAEGELTVIPLTDAGEVSSVVEKFRGKYGAGDVKKYYSKFDVAARAQMP